jgi:hypothetical protein
LIRAAVLVAWLVLAGTAPVRGAAPAQPGPTPTPTPTSAAPLADAASAAAQPEDEAAADEDPRSLVIFNLRMQHVELGNGNSTDLLLLRRDAAIPSRRKGVRLATLRWDLPIGRNYVNGESATGLGDLYFQGLNFRTPTKRVAIGTGLAFQLPTATDDLLGSGKWQVVPTIIPLRLLPRPHALFFTKLQNYVSVAGDDDRRDINYLSVVPTFVKILDRRHAVLFDTEMISDWERDGELRWKSGFLYATRLRGNRALWVKAEAPWGEHRFGEWTLRASIAWRKREGAQSEPAAAPAAPPPPPAQ